MNPHSIQRNSIRQVRAELTQKLTTVGEADQLLVHVLKQPRSYLYTYPEQAIDKAERETLNTLLHQRLNGVPLAHLIGVCDFFSLEFNVSPQVLIPRSETEQLVSTVIKSAPLNASVLDLGTGCGAIAVAVAYHRPDLTISASDISLEALEIAQQNAKQHGLTQIQWLHSDWFQEFSQQRFNLIVSNPPYVERSDPALEDNVAANEPAIALFAADSGSACLRYIIQQAPNHLDNNGLLLTEHGYQQAALVADLMHTADFTNIQCLRDTTGTPRIGIGVKP